MAEKIPDDMRKRLLKDDFMSKCCLCGSEQRQWHHNFEYARKALNKDWCILPLCPTHHEMVRKIEVRRLLDWAMLNRVSNEELRKYGRAMDYVARKAWLNMLFGEFSPRNMCSHFRSGFYKTKTIA